MGNSLVDPDVLAKEVTKRTGHKRGKKDYDKSWWRNYLESLGVDAAEMIAYPGIETLSGMANEDLPRFAKGLGLSALSGAGNIAIPKGLGALTKVGKKSKVFGTDLGKFGKEVIEKTGERLPSFADETGAVGNIAKLKAERLIKEAGGKVGKQSGSVLHYTDKSGKAGTVDLEGRIGTRQFNLNPRAKGDSPRQLDEDIVGKNRGEDYETMRANRDDIRSRAEDASKLPPMRKEMRATKPSYASDASGMSTEELNRPGRFYKIGRSGEPSYLGKKVDAGKLGPDEAIIHVKPGSEPEIYQGSGPNSALERFRKTKTYRSLQPTEAHAGVPIKGGKARQTVKATAIPEVDVSAGRFKLKTTIGKKPISFASEFDKGAYSVAVGKKPDKQLLTELSIQTGFDDDTILQHGIRLRNRVDKLAAGSGPIKLEPRSIQVLSDAKKWKDLGAGEKVKNVIGLPSEFKFSIDLPALRQSFRPTVLHPLKSGLPALKKSFGATTERGYREALESLVEESPVHGALDTATALGPSKAKELYPNIERLQKLAGGKGDLYEYFGGGSLGEKAPLGLGNLPKVSKRMYDIYQRTIRGKEMERLAESAGTDIKGLLSRRSMSDLAENENPLDSLFYLKDLAKNNKPLLGKLGKLQTDKDINQMFLNESKTPGDISNLLKSHAPEELSDMVNLTNERTGFGPLPGNVAENLSQIFTAPRNLSSKLQQLNPLNMMPRSMTEKIPGLKAASEFGAAGRYGSNTAYADFMKDNAKLAAGYIGGGLAASAMGAEVEPNPLATNFGVRFGNYKPDLFGGESAFPKTFARMFTKDRISSKGKPYRLEPEKGESPYQDVEKFWRGRLRPGLPSLTMNLLKQENYLGEDISKPYEWAKDLPGPLGTIGSLPYSREIGEQFSPAYPEDVYDAFNVEGPAAGLAQIPLGLLGSGAATYDPYDNTSPYKPLKKFIRIEKGKGKSTKSPKRRFVIS